MAIARVEITNWENWGMLVKSWATNKNYFDAKGNPIPRPANLAELQAQCVQYGVGITVPPRIKGIQFVQSNQETLLVRLPDAGMVADTEAAIQANPNGYPLPDFYRPVYSTPLLGPNDQPFYSDEPKITATNSMIFHACRIGDYTIAQCG